MTNEEAVKIIRKEERWEDGSYREALNIAAAAIEKQVPKKPECPTDTWLCPSCGKAVEYQTMLGENILYSGQHDYCPWCGQRIQWEEDEK